MSVAVPLSGETEPVTFSKDVAPVLYEHCVSCHRPGGLAPFSLLTYQDARPRAASIAAVRSRTMPSWPLDPGVVELVGERRLPARAVDLIGQCAAGGALPEFREALRLHAEWVPALTGLTWLLAAVVRDSARHFGGHSQTSRVVQGRSRYRGAVTGQGCLVFLVVNALIHAA